MALRRGAGNAMPTCNPCTEGDHGRCATAIGQAYLQVTDSTYACRCYWDDVADHQNAADERSDEIHGESEHFGRVDWGGDGRRQYEKWQEEM